MRNLVFLLFFCSLAACKHNSPPPPPPDGVNVRAPFVNIHVPNRPDYGAFEDVKPLPPAPPSR
ncbi:MAG TPA: hypothetical protein VFE62_17610 [Gemmataceae bacterium]|nr:hypothetical protein [Gemmataceae bacterium]